MSGQIGITVSGIQEKCTIEHGCPRHAVHVGSKKEANKLISLERSEHVMKNIALMQEEPIVDVNDIVYNFDDYNKATHECDAPSTAFKSSFTCKECGKKYRSTLVGGEGASFMWEEYTAEQQKADALVCNCKPPMTLFKKNGTVWECKKCGSKFELGSGIGEESISTWRQI